MFAPILALAGTQAQAGGAQPNPIMTMIPFILMFAIFYFMLIRPQKQQQKKHQAMLDALKKGDKIVTAGGLIGKVLNVKDKDVVIKVGDDDIKLEVLRSSISQVVSE